MLDKIKILLNIQDDAQDELLSTLMGLCREEAYVYCNLPAYNEKLDFVVIQMVIERYERVLKPMHMQHIEPTKRYCDLIIPQGGHNEVAIHLLTDYIKGRLNKI